MLESQQKPGNLTGDTAHAKHITNTELWLSSYNRGNVVTQSRIICSDTPHKATGLLGTPILHPGANFTTRPPILHYAAFFFFFFFLPRVILPLVEHWGSILLCLFAKFRTYSNLRTLSVWYEDSSTFQQNVILREKGWLRMSQAWHSAYHAKVSSSDQFCFSAWYPRGNLHDSKHSVLLPISF